MTATVLGRKAGSGSGEDRDDFTRTWIETYLVQTTSYTDGPITVLSAFGLPQLYTYYSLGNDLDTGARVKRRTPRRLDNSNLIWEVDIEWSTDTEDEQEEDENPLLRPPDVTFSFETQRVLVPGELNQNVVDPDAVQWATGITAPNGELFDPQPEMDESRPTLSIARNEEAIVGAELMEWADAVNKDTFLGAQPRQLKMLAPSAVLQFENGVRFWRVTYAMQYKRTTWDIQLLNAGTFYLDAGNGNAKTPFKDAEGNRYVGLLAADGDELAAGAAVTYTRLKVYKERFFADLNFGNLL